MRIFAALFEEASQLGKKISLVERFLLGFLVRLFFFVLILKNLYRIEAFTSGNFLGMRFYPDILCRNTRLYEV